MHFYSMHKKVVMSHKVYIRGAFYFTMLWISQVFLGSQVWLESVALQWNTKHQIICIKGQFLPHQAV